MVLVSAADGDMTDSEIARIGGLVSRLPVFRAYDMNRLADDSAECADLLEEEDGLDRAIDRVAAALPARLAETAYAVACDIAAADGKVSQEGSAAAGNAAPPAGDRPPCRRRDRTRRPRPLQPRCSGLNPPPPTPVCAP